MVLKGKVINGVIVVEDASALREGEEVEVVKHDLPSKGRKKKQLNFAEKLRKWSGTGEGLPPDFAKNHDHYLYGVPKK